MKLSVLLFFILAVSESALALKNFYPLLKSYPLPVHGDVGEPLLLTPLIENGNVDVAREKAAVKHEETGEVKSYAGYLTVNKKYNSNLFFWFFPAKISAKNAPVVLWLQGGPGATSLFGLFTENGPFIVTKNQTLKERKYSWNVNHNVIYFDNPVGTGYSFTDNDLGYATNQTDVGIDLLAALIQFFDLFPELQSNEFYVTGESYAGKYVPAVSRVIHDYNLDADIKINLQGLAMGNGWSDPINQINYSDYLYQLGLLDFNGRDQFKRMENKARDLMKQHKYYEASQVLDRLTDGDLTNETTLFKNLTGFDFYFNYLHTSDSNSSDFFIEWVQRPDVRKALHVGNHTFGNTDKMVEKFLRNDITQSVTDFVSSLLKHYRVLIYNGQLDIIVAYPLTEKYLQNLNWDGAEKYKTASRKFWLVGNELAGYSKTVENLTEVLVRNAGHMVPADQPKWAWDLITRFTHHKNF